MTREAGFYVGTKKSLRHLTILLIYMKLFFLHKAFTMFFFFFLATKQFSLRANLTILAHFTY